MVKSSVIDGKHNRHDRSLKSTRVILSCPSKRQFTAGFSFGAMGHICTLKFYAGQTIFQIITRSIFSFIVYI